MAEKCEWCNGYGRSLDYGHTYNQEAINLLTQLWNAANHDLKAEVWDEHRRGNEWPKVGDRRGKFCSKKCVSEARADKFYGSWHSRGWFS